MKRSVLGIVLSMVMVLSLVSCGKKEAAVETEATVAETKAAPVETKAQEEVSPSAPEGYLVGVGTSDITPKEPVEIVGNISAKKASEVASPLMVKAAVIRAGETGAILVTVDTLKCPEPEEAIRKVSELTGIPKENIMVSASHTHSAPFYTYYFDNFTESILEAVKKAEEDLEPCTLETGSTEVKGVSENRRLLASDGTVWNNFLLPEEERKELEAAGPVDNTVTLLTARTDDGKLKAVVWNFADHPNTENSGKISADYPGYVQEKVNKKLGYDTVTLFINGAAGDIDTFKSTDEVSDALTDAIVKAATKTKKIEKTEIRGIQDTLSISERDAEFASGEIKKKWPSDYDSFKTSYDTTKKTGRKKTSVPISAISFGEDLVISAEPGELFSTYGLQVRDISTFGNTMIAEATNGFAGYIPTKKDFALGGYETWYGQHSFLDEEAGELIVAKMKKQVRDLEKEAGLTVLQDGLKMEVYKVADTENVIVKFDREADGFTDQSNYEVTDENGKTVQVKNAVSAFAELGGAVPNVFKLSFSKQLPEGTYTIRAKNMLVAGSKDNKVYAPVRAAFTIGEDTASGKGVTGTASMEVFRVQDGSNIIVKFSEELSGCTEAENYSVTDKNGKSYVIKEAKSAFAELGGEVPNVFKLTLSEKLPDGTYTVTAKDLTGAAGKLAPLTATAVIGGKIDLAAMLAASFPSTTAKMTIQKVVTTSAVIVKFSEPLEGCTEPAQYVIVDKDGRGYSVIKAKSAFAELGGEITDVFRVTTSEEMPAGEYRVYAFGMTNKAGPVGYMTADFSITASTPKGGQGAAAVTVTPYKYINNFNIIVRFNEEVGGCTDVPNYVVTDAKGTPVAIKEVRSAFDELGGTVTNVFRIIFAAPLANGVYNLTVNGLTDGGEECKPAATVFNIPGTPDVYVGTYASSESSGSSGSDGPAAPTQDGLGMSVYGEPGSNYVIVKFDREADGATEASNYEVRNSSGSRIPIVSAASAFAQIQVPNTFKITFREELAAGNYTITAKNQYDRKGTYKPVSASFTVVNRSAEAADIWLTFAQPLADGSYEVDISNLSLPEGVLPQQKVSFVIGDAVEQPPRLLGASGAAEGFEVTCEVVDACNVVLHMNRTPAGVFTLSNYQVKNTATGQTVAISKMTQVSGELRMGVYKVIDNKNLIVRFNKETNGATETVNYEIRNEEGTVQPIASVVSAFAELGGEATNVFHITTVNELPKGTYTVLARNLTENGKVLPPVEKEFTIGGSGGDDKLKGLTVNVYSVVDRKNVIVQFNKEADGATEATNYTVTGSDGDRGITSVVSAFVEIGGAAPNVFKITFAEELPDGSYRISVKNQFDPEQMKTYETVSTHLTVGEASSSFMVGVGSYDITPNGMVPLAGDTDSTPSTGLDTRLYVKATVISTGLDKAVFVTVDTLKFPEQDVVIRNVASQVGVSEENVFITASHTHSAPIYSYYYDNFADSIASAVADAMNDMEECTLYVSSGMTSGLTKNRRWIDENGSAWNEWFVPAEVKKKCTNNGPEDEEVEVLSVVDKNGKYKAILWNYACHACANLESTISADYPGHVQTGVNDLLGYDTMTMYLTGAAGDVNPNASMKTMASGISGVIVNSLSAKTKIEKAEISAAKQHVSVAKRNAAFAEAEITKKWASQVEHFRTEYNNMKKAEKDTYSIPVSALNIGGQFVVSADPGELFCGTGKNIKELSPAAHTMIAEATNGFTGYIPTMEDYAEGGYETWYGSHSYLEEDASEKIRVACIEGISAVTGQEIDPHGRTGLTMTIHQVEDASHVIVKFDREAEGYTETVNYEVKDSFGNVKAVSAAASAFTDTQTPNTFRLTFGEALPEGDYVITAKNMKDASGTYAPVTCAFTVVPALEVSVYKVEDEKNFIVRFNKEVDGCTTSANYEVKDISGTAKTVSAAASAFADTQTPNTFRLTMAEELAEGIYTVTAKNMTGSGITYAPASCEFTVSQGQSGLEISIHKVENASSVIVKFNKEADGFTTAANYEVKDGSGNTKTVSTAASAFADTETPNTFRLTFAEPLPAGTYTVMAKNMTDGGGKYAPVSTSFELIGITTFAVEDEKNVIVQFNKAVDGCTEAANYEVKDSSGTAKTVAAAESAYGKTEVPNTFRLTMAEELAEGIYTVTAKNMTGSGITYAPATCTFEVNAGREGLTIKTYRVRDSKNVVIQLNKDVTGADNKDCYEVTDGSGNVQTISAVANSWDELEHTAANVFKLTFANELAPGSYTIKAKNMSDTDGKYAPATCTLTMVGISTYSVVDAKNVIVQYTADVGNATETGFYDVTEGEGTVNPSTVASAYEELGRKVPNVFKLTFANDLSAGSHTVTAKNMILILDGVLYEKLTCEFEVSAGREGLTITTYRVRDNKNVVIQLNKDVTGADQKDCYEVTDGSGNVQEISAVAGAFEEMDRQAANVFKLTFANELAPGSYTVKAKNMSDTDGKYAPATCTLTMVGISTYSVVDAKNVIVQYTAEVGNATETGFYDVTEGEGAVIPSTVVSAYDELGGIAPNVFKLTFANDLSAGSHTVTAKNMILGGVLYEKLTCTFNVGLTTMKRLSRPAAVEKESVVEILSVEEPEEEEDKTEDIPATENIAVIPEQIAEPKKGEVEEDDSEVLPGTAVEKN